MKKSISSRSGRIFTAKPRKFPEAVNPEVSVPSSTEYVAFKVTNNTGAYLYCVDSSDPVVYSNTWFGVDADNQQGYLNGQIDENGDITGYWVYNFYKTFGTLENNIYYGTVCLTILTTSDGYPYLAQETDNYLYDRGLDSNGNEIDLKFNFNWQNFINYDPYTGANFGANSSSYSDLDNVYPNLFSNNYGLVGLNADWAYFPVGYGIDFTLEIPSGSVWGPSSAYTYFTTDNLTDSSEQYVWFPEQPARGNYTISTQDNQQLITQVAPYQNGSCWSRAYGALTQNTSTQEIDTADESVSYGIGATYGTWSMDFCSGDSEFLVCESLYLTERPYLSPETTNNYGDGQAPTYYLEIDGIETLWQNQAAGYPENSCLQGGAFCKGVYTQGFPVPVGDSTYLGVWVRSSMQMIEAVMGDTGEVVVPANIIFTYYLLNDDGSVRSPITLPNGKTYWSLLEQNYDFCANTLTPYLNSKVVRLYPYISTWSSSTIPSGYSVTTKYKNYTYTQNK